MANVIINDTHLTDIADAIRDKKGVSTTYLPSEMANAISSISTSGGGSTTTGMVLLGNGFVSNLQSYRLISFVPQGININLTTDKNWKMLFSLIGKGKGVWRYTAKTGTFERMNNDNSTQYATRNYFTDEKYDDFVFPHTLDWTDKTVAMTSGTVGNDYFNPSFLPVIWIEE